MDKVSDIGDIMCVVGAVDTNTKPVFERDNTMATLESLKSQIADFVTPDLVDRWSQDSEQILFFEYEVLDALQIDVCLDDRRYDILLEYFENLCDAQINLNLSELIGFLKGNSNV